MDRGAPLHLIQSYFTNVHQTLPQRLSGFTSTGVDPSTYATPLKFMSIALLIV
ncbi:hypothetical protein FRC00_001075, partial [Tulasnella sp. 408]